MTQLELNLILMLQKAYYTIDDLLAQIQTGFDGEECDQLCEESVALMKTIEIDTPEIFNIIAVDVE